MPMFLIVFKKLIGSWLKGLALLFRAELIIRYGIRKDIFPLAKPVEGFAFLCNVEHGPPLEIV